MCVVRTHAKTDTHTHRQTYIHKCASVPSYIYSENPHSYLHVRLSLFSSGPYSRMMASSPALATRSSLWVNSSNSDSSPLECASPSSFSSFFFSACSRFNFFLLLCSSKRLFVLASTLTYVNQNQNYYLHYICTGLKMYNYFFKRYLGI